MNIFLTTNWLYLQIFLTLLTPIISFPHLQRLSGRTLWAGWRLTLQQILKPEHCQVVTDNHRLRLIRFIPGASSNFSPRVSRQRCTRKTWAWCSGNNERNSNSNGNSNGNSNANQSTATESKHSRNSKSKSNSKATITITVWTWTAVGHVNKCVYMRLTPPVASVYNSWGLRPIGLAERGEWATGQENRGNGNSNIL